MADPSPDSARKAYQNSFTAKVQRFMVTNTQVFNELTKEVTSTTTPCLLPKSSYYGDPLPLEYAMGVPAHISHQRLLQLLSPGDIIRGRVILKTPLALGVQITSLVASHKVRDFSELDIRGLVQHEHLATEKSKCDGVLQEMEVDDVIQAVVLCRQESHLDMSFSAEHVSQLCQSGTLPEGVHLGYLDGVRAAIDRKRPNSPGLFLSELVDFPGFVNPCSSDNLKEVLGVSGCGVETNPSLIKTIQSAKYPTSDYFDALRKVQRHKWSLDTVGIGVKLFKKGEVEQAQKLLHHALDIDPTNVEGLVARGALSANAGRYSEAIVDFETALTINHTHKNARKYLVETQVAYGEELEKQGRLERAVVCYQEAVTDDPSQEAAKTRLEILKRVLIKKAAEKVERERKEAAEKARLKKLHSLIKEEKEKKKSTKAKKTKKKNRHVKKRKKSYARKALKDSETDSSDSEVSSISSRSRSRESPGARKKKNYSSRSPSTSLQRSRGTKRRSQSSSSPSHSSSWYKETRNYVRSKLRSSRSPKGKKSRSSSPKESRRMFSRSPSTKGSPAPKSKRSSRPPGLKGQGHLAPGRGDIQGCILGVPEHMTEDVPGTHSKQT